jgi:hypothetical protein
VKEQIEYKSGTKYRDRGTKKNKANTKEQIEYKSGTKI